MKINYRKNDVVEGIVNNVVAYGAFVYIDYHTSGLIHISEITNAFVSNIHQHLVVGQKIHCRVIDVDNEKGHLRLSLKNIQKNIKPRILRRDRLLQQKHNLLPANELGFSSLKNNLNTWIEKEELC